MAKFIKLTMDVGPTWIGVSHIVGFYRFKDRTQIATVIDKVGAEKDHQLFVHETPEQILALIERGEAA